MTEYNIHCMSWGDQRLPNPRVLADGFAATGRFAPISAWRGASSLLRQHSLWEVLWLRPFAEPTKDPGGASARAITHLRSTRALRGWRTGLWWQSGAASVEEPVEQHMLLGDVAALITTGTVA